MDWVFRLFKSSIGSKALMALTGAGLLLFVIGHMIGNLLVFAGPEALNEYAAGLKGMPLLVWGTRFGLLGLVTVHVLVAFRLYMANSAARPERYAVKRDQTAQITGKTMIISGALLLAFIVYHLLHFTLGAVGSDYFAAEHLYNLNGEMVPNVYHMVVSGFSKAPVMASYVVAMVLLGSHLSHGISSLFQSLGLSSPRYEPLVKNLGVGLATFIVVGNISMPVAIFFGIIGMPAAGV